MDQLQQQPQKKAKNKRNRNNESGNDEMQRVRRKTKGQDMAPKNRKKKAHGK